MNILIFNCGSSSLNYKLFSTTDGVTLETSVWGKAHRVGVTGTAEPFIAHNRPEKEIIQRCQLDSHRQAAGLILEHLGSLGVTIDIVGHRFVHGGAAFQTSAWLDDETFAKLEACLSLAPIHNPNSASVIQVVAEIMPEVPQYVTFDTAFHATMPPAATTYALPYELAQAHGLRKYGFHGLSYQDISAKTVAYLEREAIDLRMVACHLGTGGSSVAAIKGGRSCDTSMGYSPLPGLVMSTRSGDIDPAIVLYLIEQQHYSVDQVSRLLNKESGLLGISGLSSDIRDLIQAMKENGHQRARLAFDVYIHRLKGTIGAMAAALEGIDTLVFTDDVGLFCPEVRAAACAGMSWCGIELDEKRNEHATGKTIARISPDEAPVAVLVVPNDEEWVIAMEGARLSRHRNT